MGQTTSTPSSSAASSASTTGSQQPRRAAPWRRSFTQSPSSTSQPESRSPSVNRLSQILQSATDTPPAAQRPSRLQRARTSFTNNLPSSVTRRARDLTPLSHASLSSSATRTASTHPDDRQSEPSPTFTLPDIQAPELGLDFADLASSITATRPLTPISVSRRSSLRMPNSWSDRLASLRSSRNGGTNNIPPRRRHSPRRQSEDNTALLSRLLSAAAAATAATLLDGHEDAVAGSRGATPNAEGDDGTFDGFLQLLENGRLASALRQGGRSSEPNASGTGSAHAPLNFFRMFTFGSSSSAAPRTASGQSQPLTADSDSTVPSGEGRMVPIIIVGIRAMTPGIGGNTPDNGIPPFLDAISALPTTPFDDGTGSPFGDDSMGHDTIDDILHSSAANSSRFPRRRRASMGAVNNFPSAYDAQRHHRPPERTRPSSGTSESASWPRPPPVTPASPTLSTVTSVDSTPAPTRPTTRPSTPSRRSSVVRTTTSTNLDTTAQELAPRPRTARRRLSESDHARGNYASRRNGIVEPDDVPTENTRSWIIYVLGGSYPENHPILTTPSLFTDSPTYEDMMLLSALLGPAKPPVASENDVAEAPGIFKIELSPGSAIALVAVEINGDKKVPVLAEQRCLVCLCDFEQQEEARRLVKCGHLFHRECIDEWLTKGRNSCPLCRGQGVDEKDNAAEDTAVPDSTRHPAAPEASGLVA